jgi:hypothetical protein
MATTKRAHLIIGGFPPGSVAGHDMNFARLRLLQNLQTEMSLSVTVANDFQDIERWLPGAGFLITYVAGPYPVGPENDALLKWLKGGGRWLALHGTSGGKAVKTNRDGRPVKKMVKAEHHQTLGCFFLNHPPLCEFQVTVAGDHPVTQGLPNSFTVQDELYLIELQDPAASRVLLTTELVEDLSPPGFGFVYDEDTSVLPDGTTRVLSYARDIDRGEVVYVGLGHCHVDRLNNASPVDPSINPDGTMPPDFRGVWDHKAFKQLMQNAIAWGTGKS